MLGASQVGLTDDPLLQRALAQCPAGARAGDHRAAGPGTVPGPGPLPPHVTLGLVSIKAARELYGVAVSADGVLDEAETARLRTKVAAE